MTSSHAQNLSNGQPLTTSALASDGSSTLKLRAAAAARPPATRRLNFIPALSPVLRYLAMGTRNDSRHPPRFAESPYRRRVEDPAQGLSRQPEYYRKVS